MPRLWRLWRLGRGWSPAWAGHMWGRARIDGGGAAATPAGAENLLVLSDVHLGEDVLAAGPEHLALYIRALNLNLAAFIRHHRQSRRGCSPWHLVFNGDMFDFVKVSVAPDESDLAAWAGAQMSRGAFAQVLKNTPANVVFKLRRILEIHRPVFRELARFVAEGHRLTLVEGNHDAEFYFPSVRLALRDELLRLAQVEGAAGKEAFRARVHFSTWFVAKPGVYHIEHGHQHDEYCSFEYNLAPLADADSGLLATPLSHQPMPYFAELLGDFSTHDVHHWSWRRAWQLVGRLGAGGTLRLFGLYLWIGGRLWLEARAKGAQLRHLWALRHREALSQLGEVGPYRAHVLGLLDALRAMPAEVVGGKLLNLFFFDRVVLWLLGLVLMPAALWAGGPRAALLLLGALATVTCALSSGQRQDLVATLRHAAAQVADITGAQTVIFGHSHRPESVALAPAFGVGRFGRQPCYINTGSWVTREILLGEGGQGMTYVELVGGEARLLRWDTALARGSAC